LTIPSFTTAFVLLVVSFASGQITPIPLTQRQACERFTDAVIRIEAGGRSRGTGFLVSSDGFILTAGHVITDEKSGQFFPLFSLDFQMVVVNSQASYNQ